MSSGGTKHDTTHHRLKAVDLPRLLPGMWHDGGGLWLQVRGKSRSWLFRWSRDNHAKVMGIGPLHTISLAKAREKAREARELLLDGVDPLEAREAQRQSRKIASATAMTFRQVAATYIAAHEPGWKSAKHAAQWPATLEAYVYPIIGELSVQAVDVGLVMKVLEQAVLAGADKKPLWTAKPETAGRVRGRIESILDYATARGWRKGENPARWRGHLESLLPKKSRVKRIEPHAALPFADMPAFMADLRSREGLAARALEFVILTCARSGEALGATRREMDLEGRVWVVPGARMKAGREHRVPLSAAALALLRALPKGGPDERPFKLSTTGMNRLMRRMGRDDLTVHGFRSAFRDWAAGMTAFPSEAAELALAHTVGNKVEAAYRRGDLFEKRRQLAEAWSSFCGGANHDAHVVNLARHAAR